MNLLTYRTSREGPLDVTFRDWFPYKSPLLEEHLPSVYQAPLDPNIFFVPKAIRKPVKVLGIFVPSGGKSVKVLGIFVPSCALMAHGVGHYHFL